MAFLSCSPHPCSLPGLGQRSLPSTAAVGHRANTPWMASPGRMIQGSPPSGLLPVPIHDKCLPVPWGSFSQATGIFTTQEETDGDDPLSPKGREGTRIKDAGIPGSQQTSGLFLSVHQPQAS